MKEFSRVVSTDGQTDFAERIKLKTKEEFKIKVMYNPVIIKNGKGDLVIIHCCDMIKNDDFTDSIVYKSISVGL